MKGTISTERRAILLAVVAGLMHGASLPPFSHGWIVIGSVIAWWAAMSRAGNFRASLVVGATYGAVLHLLVFHWLFFLPDVPIALLALGYLGLCGLGTFWTVLLSGVHRGAVEVWGRRAGVWLLPILWVGLEGARAWGLFGFPWVDLANSLTVHPVAIQVAAWGGAAAVSFLVAAVGTLLAMALDRRVWLGPSWKPGLAALTCLGVWIGAGALRLDGAHPIAGLQVALVQGNVPPNLKWRSGMRERSFDIYGRKTREVAATGEVDLDLVIWPETALPCYLDPGPDETCREWVSGLARETGAAILVGGLARDPSRPEMRSYFNSTFMFSAAGEDLGRYDKIHLVPFGEMFPFDDRFDWLKRIDLGEGDFAPGSNEGPIGPEGLKLGVAICFESLFPAHARRLAARGADLLVIVTNDAWFGDSRAIDQHAMIAALRAVETGLPVARCANTGISGFVDPWGRYLSQTPLLEVATLTNRVPVKLPDTVFVRSRGWFGRSLLLIFLGVAAAGIVRRPWRSA